MIFTLALEGGIDSGSGVSEPCRPRGSGGVWGPEVRRYELCLEEELGVKSSEAQVTRAPPSLSLGGWFFLWDLQQGCGSLWGPQLWGETVVTKEGKQGFLVPGRLAMGAWRWPFCLPSSPPKPRLSFSFKNYITPEAQFLCLKNSNNLLQDLNLLDCLFSILNLWLFPLTNVKTARRKHPKLIL